MSQFGTAAHPPLSSPRVDVVRSRWRWFYPLILAATITVASGRGQVAGPDIINIDKVVHFSVFGLLATLVLRAPGLRHGILAILIVSIFAAADEIRQGFTPGRSMEFADWLADTAGAAVAVAVYSGWSWYRRVLETPVLWRRFRANAPMRPALKSSSRTSVALS